MDQEAVERYERGLLKDPLLERRETHRTEFPYWLPTNGSPAVERPLIGAPVDQGLLLDTRDGFTTISYQAIGRSFTFDDALLERPGASKLEVALLRSWGMGDAEVRTFADKGAVALKIQKPASLTQLLRSVGYSEPSKYHQDGLKWAWNSCGLGKGYFREQVSASDVMVGEGTALLASVAECGKIGDTSHEYLIAARMRVGDAILQDDEIGGCDPL